MTHARGTRTIPMHLHGLGVVVVVGGGSTRADVRYDAAPHHRGHTLRKRTRKHKHPLSDLALQEKNSGPRVVIDAGEK